MDGPTYAGCMETLNPVVNFGDMNVQISACLFVSLLTGLGSLHAQLSTQTIDVDGDSRTYLEYLPEGFDNTQNLPLVMSFHGGGGQAQDQLNIADLRDRADQDGFVLVYPDAIPDPNDDGSTNWQVVVSGTLPFTNPNPHSDIDFVDALIDKMATVHNIDTTRVYAMGYSNGGGFSFDLACRLNHKITGIGVSARTMYAESFAECNVVHPTPVVTILGTNDFISPYDGVVYEGTLYYHSNDECNDLWIAANGLQSAPVVTDVPNTSTNDGSSAELYTWTSSDGCHELLHYKVNGGDHDWPGTFGNMDFVTHDVIWEALSQHNMDGRIGCTTSSITDAESADMEIQLYPNPVQTQLKVSGVLPDAPIEIWNAQGQCVLETALVQGAADIEHLATGMYTLQLPNNAVRLRFIKK